MGAWKRRDCLVHDLLYAAAAALVFGGIPLMAALVWGKRYMPFAGFFVFWLVLSLLTRKGGPYDLNTTHYED